jgi:hypothetical protein
MAKKLTWEKVRDIRTRQKTSREYADEYGVTPSTINDIWGGLSWNPPRGAPQAIALKEAA